MPFRKLPVTDDELTSAMRQLIFAYDVFVTNQPDPAKRVQAFSVETYDRLKALQGQFEKEIGERSGALAHQAGSTLVKNQAQTNLRKHVDHFFMVMNLAIDRGVLHPSVRAAFGLDVNRKKIPLCNSHSHLSYWASNIVSGETHRIAAGGIPIQFPSLAEVKAAFDDFETKHRAHSALKTNYDLQQEDVEHLRKAVKKVIRDAWNEIEFHFRTDKHSSLRNKARLWGITYGTRKGEKPEEGSE